MKELFKDAGFSGMVFLLLGIAFLLLALVKCNVVFGITGAAFVVVFGLIIDVNVKNRLKRLERDKKEEE